MKRTAAAALLATALPVAAFAQSTNLSTQGAPGAVFTLRGGVSYQPGYFGSKDYRVGPDAGFSLQYLRLGKLEFGSSYGGDPKLGFGVRGSFRYIGDRDPADYPELAGMNKIDQSVELGLGVGYRTEYLNAFAVARYGVIGHNAWVGEAGADAIVKPTDRLTLRAGPRVFFGDTKYARTYFGVTAAEAGASAFTAYQPSGGALSAGVEIGATYMIDDNWGIDSAVTWSRFTGDARNSPIVQQGSRDQWKIRIGVTRQFNVNW